MIYKSYGTTGKQCSVLGFGGMRFKSIDDQDACVEMMIEAAKGGVNYFDTAPGYFGVKSETVFGAGFKELRKQNLPFYCATKTFASTEKAIRKEIEAQLRPPERRMAPYPAKVITLAIGKQMVVREVERKDVPTLLNAVRPTLGIPRDYYDIVGARVYAELLGWYRYRVRDHYCIIGQVDGFLVGIVNGRMYTKEIGMSYHTLAVERGLRIGAHLFAAKMEHHLEYLGQSEVSITAESPIGFRRWMIEYGLDP